MSTVRERLEQLKKNKGIKGDSELLRQIHPYLLREGKTKYSDVKEFVNKTKGTFSQMIDGKNGRIFDQDFYLPLEIVLETSMAYLLEGRGEAMPKKNDRGLKYAAATDTKGNYEKLIEEEVYLEQDEYQWTLLDYMLDYDSKYGLEFFAGRDELPLNEVGLYKYGHHLNANFHDESELINALLKHCSVETVLKYFNGFHFVENAIDPNNTLDEDMETIFENTPKLIEREDVRHALSNFKTMPLGKVNPGLYSIDGKPSGNTGFVNIFFSMMLDYGLQYDRNPEDNVLIELLDKAYEINEAIMPMILSLPYDRYQMGNYGYVYSGDVICGSIAWINVDVNLSDLYKGELLEKINKLSAQVQAFHEKITASSKAVVLGQEMQLTKQANPAFYDFYRLMNKSGCDYIATYEEERSESKDFFLLPDGQKTAIDAGMEMKYAQALKALAMIDKISEGALGEGKIYFFPEINNRSFYVFADNVSGFAPTEVIVGERYDNLAEFLTWTCLFTPYFQAASDQILTLVRSLKEYGIAKKDLNAVLDSFKSYFARSLLRYDKKTERGKVLIANAHARIVWIDLFTDDIKEQFK